MRAVRLLISLAAVAAVTLAGYKLIPVNATTVGFAYLLLVLLIASTWGFVEAAVCSVACTLVFNFFFLPPVGTFTIADPQNWVALFSFLSTALVASRLSAQVKRRAFDAIGRQQDVERLYTFSRAILLIESGEPFAKQLTQKLAGIFDLSAAVLYDRRSGEFHRAGPSDCTASDSQLHDAALEGTSFAGPQRRYVITAIRLGTEPIASLALEGAHMPDSVLQGVANLVAIGLERARAQGLAHQVEVARQSEQLRTTLIDAMAHEFKTPLTSIKAATTSLLANPGQHPAGQMELLKIADEEAEHLRELIDNAVEMARLDTANIELHLQPSNIAEIVSEVVASMQTGIDNRQVAVTANGKLHTATVDQRLLRLAIKQLLDNALKYSPPNTPVSVRVYGSDSGIAIEIQDEGKGIPAQEQSRIFERFYRSPSVKQRIPGSGLGLTIAQSIVRAHNGDLTVESRPGQTTFRVTLSADRQGEQN